MFDDVSKIDGIPSNKLQEGRQPGTSTTSTTSSIIRVQIGQKGGGGVIAGTGTGGDGDQKESFPQGKNKREARDGMSGSQEKRPNADLGIYWRHMEQLKKEKEIEDAISDRVNTTTKY